MADVFAELQEEMGIEKKVSCSTHIGLMIRMDLQRGIDAGHDV